MKVRLYAPGDYWGLDEKAREEIVNGCGAAGSKFDFVPDRILGLKITEACNIHDYMYFTGVDLSDKKTSDRVFLNNILRIIEVKGGWLKFLRRRIARKYYLAVKIFGSNAYWADKNQVAHFREVVIDG